MIDFTEIYVQLIIGVFSLLSMTLTFILTQKNKKIEQIKQQTHTNDMYPILTTHPVHVNINEHIRNSRLLGSELTNIADGRKKLARDFVEYAINCWKEPCMRFAEEAQKCIDECGTNCNECNRIYSLAMKMFSDGRESIEQLSNWNIDSSDYEAVIIFRDKFLEWDKIRLERLTRKISDIALMNDTYKNCSIKAARILEAIDDYNFDIISNGRYVLARLNGELSGKHYKFYEL